MIIHGLGTVIVIATIAAGAVITGPTTTRLPQETNYVDATHTTPIDTMTTVQPTELPLITCFCNLPECLAPAGGDGICSTRLGCFAEVRTVLPEMEESVKPTGFTATESAITVNGSAVFPTIPEIIETETTPQVTEPSSERGSYGCLDLLHYSKQPCDEILKSMESDASEFPIIQAPTNGAQPNDALVFAFHCCQTPKCNGNQSGPAEGSVKSAQAVLVAAFKSSLALNGDLKSKTENNSTEEVEIDPLAKLATKYGVTSPHLNKEIMVLETGPAVIALGEPKPPSALKSESSEDAEIGSTTPAVPAAMPPILPEAVPVQQEMLLNDTVTNMKHFIAKRHDNQRGPPILKQTTDDQENVGDFDDDIIAAEIAAATATAKSLPMQDQKNSGSPNHGGVPDFIPPPPVLQKEKESYLSSNNYLDEDNDITNWMIGITCAIAVACLVGLTLLILSAFRIMRRSDIFRNYQSVCSNPGRPCACTGGLMRRPSYSQLDAAAAAVNRTSTTAPLLPPPNPGHKSRRGGHANAGASYSDATGDTTYVLTHIPNNAVPLIPVVRR